MANFGDLKMKVIVGEQPVMRPCLLEVDGKKENVLFHCWTHESEVVAPSITIGGHNGGVISSTLALVEKEDGQMVKVKPKRVKFLDTQAVMSEYAYFDDCIKDKDEYV